jgi:hypothetical protein
VWKTYAARQAFALDGIVASLRGERAQVIGDDGRTRWRPEEKEMGPESLSLSPYEARLRERHWRDRQVHYLRQLLEIAGTDALPVVVARMPMRDAAFRLRARVDPGAESRLLAALATAREAGASATLLNVPTGVAIGIDDRFFLDERHLATAGARLFTRHVAGWATAQYELR